MLKQLRDANMQTGYTGGLCLKFVQDSFGTDHPYPTAMAAWNANYGGGNHPGELPPMGVTVPVYFSLGSEPAGHVAISLDDGWVASSTQAGTHPTPYFHKSLNDLISVYGQYNGGCNYLGWSEYVGTVRVVQEVSDNATDAEIQAAYLEILERPADTDGIAHYRNFPIAFVRQDLMNSVERQTMLANKQAQADAIAAAQASAAAQAQADAAKAAQAAADLSAREKAAAEQAAAVPVVVPTPEPTPVVEPVNDPTAQPTPNVPVIPIWLQKLIQLFIDLIKKLITKGK